MTTRELSIKDIVGYTNGQDEDGEVFVIFVTSKSEHIRAIDIVIDTEEDAELAKSQDVFKNYPRNVGFVQPRYLDIAGHKLNPEFVDMNAKDFHFSFNEISYYINRISLNVAEEVFTDADSNLLYMSLGMEKL